MGTLKRYRYSAVVVVVATAFTLLAFNHQEYKMRTIKREHKTVFHMVEGLTTYRAMPTGTCPMETLNPFVFLNHHGPQIFPANNKGLPFGPHPHRGFETVTFIVDGDLKHRDNTGFESIITAGGVQWMTAGKGIIHAEESSDRFLKEGGNVEVIQLWLNLPKAKKWVDPNYQGIPYEKIAHIPSKDGKTTVNLISGKWEGKEGPVKSITNTFLSSVAFKKGGRFNVNIPYNRKVFFYVVNGQVKINNDHIVNKLTLVEFNKDGHFIAVEAMDDAMILFGHADPIEEPIFSKGPFVMNTKEEIKQAWQDYYDGKFGSFLE